MRKSAIAIGLLIASSAASPASAATKPEIGSAVAVVNQVLAEYEQDRRDLQIGDRVHEDERIEVALNSKGELVLDDRTMLALGPGSSVLLDRFVYNGERTKGDIAINIAKGTFRFITGAAAKPSYRIRTPVAAITVRGTIFDTYVAESGRMWLLLIEGSIRACNDQGVCRLLDRPGQILEVTEQGNMGQPTRWASLPSRNAVPFDTAFPFVGSPPAIDPNPVLTRDAILIGPMPRPPRVTPPSDQGKKTGSRKPKRTGESQKEASVYESDPGPPTGLSIGIGFGFKKGGGGHRGPSEPMPKPNRLPGDR
jgi:hypothetical protein